MTHTISTLQEQNAENCKAAVASLRFCPLPLVSAPLGRSRPLQSKPDKKHSTKNTGKDTGNDDVHVVSDIDSVCHASEPENLCPLRVGSLKAGRRDIASQSFGFFQQASVNRSLAHSASRSQPRTPTGQLFSLSRQLADTTADTTAAVTALEQQFSPMRISPDVSQLPRKGLQSAQTPPVFGDAEPQLSAGSGPLPPLSDWHTPEARAASPIPLSCTTPGSFASVAAASAADDIHLQSCSRVEQIPPTPMSLTPLPLPSPSERPTWHLSPAVTGKLCTRRDFLVTHVFDACT